MNTEKVLFLFILVILFSSLALAVPTDNINCTQIASWGYGPCNGLHAKGDTLFAINGSILQILNMSNPEAPVELGMFSTPGPIEDLLIVDDTAYLLNYYQGVWIVDISNLNVPTEISHIPTRDYGYMLDLALENNRLYLMGDNLIILDISDPQNPQLLGDHPSHGVRDFVVRDNILYIAAYMAGTFIVDATNPETPDTVASIPTENKIFDIFVKDNYAFTAENPYGLRILDISDLENPIDIGSSPTGSNPQQIIVIDTLAYITASTNGLDIVNISDPANPDILYSRNELGGNANYLTVSDTKVFCTLDYGGICVLDTSDPDQYPTKTLYLTGGAMQDIECEYPYVFAADGRMGLLVLDISNPDNIEKVYSLYDNNIFARSIETRDNLLFLTAGNDGIYIFDKYNMPELHIVNHLETSFYSYYLLPANDILYITDNKDSVHVFDISDILAPQELATIGINTNISGICEYQGHLYISAWGQGVIIFDVQNPAEPQQLTTIDPVYSANTVALKQNFLYVADDYHGVRVFDLTDPANPQELGPYSVRIDAKHMCVSDDLLYYTEYSEGLFVLDVSDPATPIFAGSYETVYGAESISAFGNIAVVEIMMGGLRLVQYDPTTNIDNEQPLKQPQNISLAQNYPNPFNPVTTINYTVPVKGHVTLRILNIMGQEIETLVDRQQNAGAYRVTFDANMLSSGVYFYQLDTDGKILTHKMVLLR